MHDRPAKYVKNHDGDTVTVILDQGFYDTKQINLRLANVWAPEIGTPEGKDVQRYVQGWLNLVSASSRSKWPLVVTTYQTKADTQLKTFDRFVANVTTADGLKSLNSDVMKYIADHNYSGGIGSERQDGGTTQASS